MRRTPTHVHRFRRAAALLALAALAAGCASAGKRYEQGLELEQRGRPADAAQRYIDALKKDRSLTEARTRLQESGTQAIDAYLGEASGYESAGGCSGTPTAPASAARSSRRRSTSAASA